MGQIGAKQSDLRLLSLALCFVLLGNQFLQLTFLIFANILQFEPLGIRQNGFHFCVGCTHDLFPLTKSFLSRHNGSKDHLSSFGALLLGDGLDL